MAKPKSEYGISRVDNKASRTHGWLVTIQRQKVVHRKHFSDGVCGGIEASLQAARDYRDGIVAFNPALPKAEYASIVKKSNRSGVVGVSRFCINKDAEEQDKRWYWIASWTNPDGTRGRAKFSIHRYGEDKALNMARMARESAMAELRGKCFDPGATKRKKSEKKARRQAWKGNDHA